MDTQTIQKQIDLTGYASLTQGQKDIYNQGTTTPIPALPTPTAPTPTPTSTPTVISSQQGLDTTNQNISNLNQQQGAYAGTSIVDYLTSIDQASDYGSRAKLAAEKGIQNYSGTSEQNTQLLSMLRGSSPVTQTMANNINNATNAGLSDPAKLAELEKAEADAQAALAKAQSAKDANDPTSLDHWMKVAQDARKVYEDQLADYNKTVADLRADRARLAIPGAKEIELAKQVNNIKTEIEQIKVANEKSKFDEFKGQTVGFAQGRGNEKDVYTNFQLMERGIALNGVLAELGIETSVRTATLDSVKDSLSDMKEDFNFQSQVQDKLLALEESIVTRAQALQANAQKSLSDILDMLKGVNPKDLTPEMQAKLQQMALNAGIPYDLVVQGLSTQNARQVFEDAMKKRQEDRLSEAEDSPAPGGFTDVLQASIDAGANPEQAAREAASLAEGMGVQVTPKMITAWTNEAKKLKKTIAPVTQTTTPKTARQVGQSLGEQINPIYQAFHPENIIQGTKDIASTVGNFFSGLFGF